ncbi:MAG: ParB/RepB/Spo0J family partition protein [Hornefia sp.]|nr:ParB/RepB/Spo0J family partition protein [Hornefia sp.]
MPVRRTIDLDKMIPNASDVINQAFDNDVTKLYPEKDVIEKIPIDNLKDNPNNHFHKIDGEKWEEFLGSVKQVGIQVPLLVRPKDGSYEIIAGHNRKRAAQEVGIESLPCIVTDVDDVEASVLVAVTNSQRENTTELEWGWAYRTTYEALKKSVGRPLINKLSHDGTINHDENKLSHSGTIKRTDDIVAEKYGIGRNTVQRKIRLTYLTKQLYDYCKQKKLKQEIMIELSYLREMTQTQLMISLLEKDINIDLEFAKKLREKDDGDISIDEVMELCREVSKENTKPIKKKDEKYSVPEDAFPDGFDTKDKKQASQYVIKALRYIKENSIKL